MVFYPEFWIFFAAVAAVCLIGFYRYIWFISVGYGFSITAVGVCLLAVYAGELDLLKLLSAILLIGYGIRLGGYLLIREFRMKSYGEKMMKEIKDGAAVPFFVKILMWVSCTLLYLVMTSPIIYRFANDLPGDGCMAAGLVIMLGGILLEAISDKQKSAAKKINPKRFCDSGVFRFVRCPNYLGEMITWTGVLVSGITALQSPGQWIIAIIGYLGIIYIMFSGARRLELRQERTYGGDPEYREYVKKTPIMVPFVPLYSVKKHKWLVG